MISHGSSDTISSSIWTCMLRRQSTTGRHTFLSKIQKIILLRMCANNSTLNVHVSLSVLLQLQRHHTRILAWHGRACFESNQPHTAAHIYCSMQKTFYYTGYGQKIQRWISRWHSVVPQLQRQHTNLEIDVPPSGTFNHTETHILPRIQKYFNINNF